MINNFKFYNFDIYLLYIYMVIILFECIM